VCDCVLCVSWWFLCVYICAYVVCQLVGMCVFVCCVIAGVLFVFVVVCICDSWGFVFVYVLWDSWQKFVKFWFTVVDWNSERILFSLRSKAELVAADCRSADVCITNK
jgi:hypothetical protein